MTSLTQRCFSLLSFLLEQKHPITVKTMAEQFHISERTVRYDLEMLQSWLEEKDIILRKKSRVGIWIENIDKARTVLGELNTSENNHYQQFFNANERKHIIIGLLFQQKTPITISMLKDKLGVSRSTIIHDLNSVEGWFKERDISLIRRQNYGIKLEVSEKQWRRALLDYIYGNFDRSNLIDFFNISDSKIMKSSRINQIAKQNISMIFGPVDLMALEKSINIIADKLGIQFADAAFAGLVIHISIAFRRLIDGEKIHMPEAQLTYLKSTKEFLVVKSVIGPLALNNDLVLPESEIGYIALHFLGAKVRKQMPDDSNNEEVDDLVQEIIYRVSAILNVDLIHDKELKYGLIIHLKPALARARFGMKNYNPLLKEIKINYEEVYKACAKASEVLKERFAITLDEDEIGYIAIHVGSAIERLRQKAKKRSLKVVVVCGSGIGTAKMLSTRLKKEFPEITIEKELSVYDLKEENIRDINLIISTITISQIFSKPVIHVHPLLNSEDIKVVRSFINQQKRVREDLMDLKLDGLMRIIKRHCDINNYEGLAQEIKLFLGLESKAGNSTFHESSVGLLDLITEETTQIKLQAEDWEEAISRTAQPLLQKGLIESTYVDAMINLKDVMGHYSIIFPGISMPHASPSFGVNNVCMALATLSNPIYIPSYNEPIKIILILGAKDQKKHIKALGELTQLLNESPQVIDALSNCDEPITLLSTLKEKLREVFI